MKQCVSYPGIAQVAYITTSDLPDDVIYRAVAGIPVSLNGTATAIKHIGEPVAEVEHDDDHNSYIEKAKLTFYSLETLPVGQHLAFVFRTVQGENFVIGAKERPYPTVKVMSSTGRLDGEAYVRKYEVSWMAKKVLATLAT